MPEHPEARTGELEELRQQVQQLQGQLGELRARVNNLFGALPIERLTRGALFIGGADFGVLIYKKGLIRKSFDGTYFWLTKRAADNVAVWTTIEQHTS